MTATRSDDQPSSSGKLALVGEKKAKKVPIVMLTCYDYPTALIEDEAGIDVIFVGDSVGTNVLGYESETEVTMEDMLHHLRAVRRGVKNSYLLVDMPHQSFQNPNLALRNARTFCSAGADGVKLEGGEEQVAVVRELSAEGIEVCGHIGFTPQTLGSKGRVQGKAFEQAKVLFDAASALEKAGAQMLVLELVTEGVAGLISDHLSIPTIGIGSGRFCDGQVLVVNDLLGISPFSRKIAKRYQEYRDKTLAAVSEFKDDVLQRRFPTEANAFPTDAQEINDLKDWIGASSL